MFEFKLPSAPAVSSSSKPGRTISPKALGSCPDFLALSNAAATVANFALPEPSPGVVAKGSTIEMSSNNDFYFKALVKIYQYFTIWNVDT